MRAYALFLTTAALTIGCHPRLQTPEPLPASAAWPEDTGLWPDAPAVVLLDELEVLDVMRDDVGYAEVRERRVLRIRNRNGLDEANIEFALRPKSELVSFRARSIAPDGTERTIDKSALAAAEASVGGEGIGQLMTAAVPGAKVGSIIEYETLFASEHPYSRFQVTYRDDLPILEARARFIISDLIRYGIRVYNSPNRATIRRGEDGLRVIEWSQRELGASPDEADTPLDSHRPWLDFRVRQWIFKATRQDLEYSWGTTLEGRVTAIEDDDSAYYEDYEPLALPTCPAAGPERVGCIVDGAIAVTRDKAPLYSFRGWGSIRPLDKMLRAGTASAFEKAVLMSRLLRDAGLEVEHAFLARDLDWPIDHKNPSTQRLNHLVLRLPVQPGLAAPLWIDPSCEHCARGEFPDYSRGLQSIIYDGEADEGEETRVEVTRGKASGDNVIEERYRVTLVPGGTTRIVNQQIERGLPAAYTARHGGGYNAREQREAALTRAADIDLRARLTRFEPITCDRAKGECNRTVEVEVPELAVTTDDRILLPLDLMGGEQPFRLPLSKRTRPMVLNSSRTIVERVEVPVPEGYVFAGGPKAHRTGSDAYSSALEVKCADGTVAVTLRTTRNRGLYQPSGHERRRAALLPSHTAREGHLAFRKSDAADRCGGAKTAAR